jgi:inner membrane transporter RhtA
MKKVKINIPPLPAVLGSILSVQIGAALAKGLFPALGAGTTAMLRIGLSAVILMAVNRPNLRSLNKKQWVAVMPYGFCLGAMNVVFYLALERIPLGLAVTLEFVGPLLLAVITSKRKIDFLWILLAAIGITLIAPWNGEGLDVLGAIMAFGAGMLWAGYIVMGRRTSAVMDGKTAVTVGMLFATLVSLPFGVNSGGLAHFSPAMILPAVGLALLSSAIPFSLEINALKQMPAKTFSILMSLEPVVATLCGLLFLNEFLSFKEWVAVALVVVASVGTMATKEK